MSFWGIELKGDKPLPFVPPPEAARLHLSQVSAAPQASTAEQAIKACND